MPIYRFMIHGRDPSVRAGEHGFYTTRHAFALSRNAAAKKVLARLMHEMTRGASAEIWAGPTPTMTIEKEWQISIRDVRSAPNKGSTFYRE